MADVIICYWLLIEFTIETHWIMLQWLRTNSFKLACFGNTTAITIILYDLYFTLSNICCTEEIQILVLAWQGNYPSSLIHECVSPNFLQSSIKTPPVLSDNGHFIFMAIYFKGPKASGWCVGVSRYISVLIMLQRHLTHSIWETRVLMMLIDYQWAQIVFGFLKLISMSLLNNVF